MGKNHLTKRTEYGTYKDIVWHPKAKGAILLFPEDVRREFGYLLYLLQIGSKLQMPQSRSMKSVAPGVDELRVRGPDGIYRTFYYSKSEFGILVVHAFKKNTQTTSNEDIKLGQRRLKELLEGYRGKKA